MNNGILTTPAGIGMSKRSSISSRIKLARQIRGLTQSELANRVHISDSAISRIENNKQSIAAEEIANFSIALEVEPSYFYQVDIDVNTLFKVD